MWGICFNLCRSKSFYRFFKKLICAKIKNMKIIFVCLFVTFYLNLSNSILCIGDEPIPKSLKDSNAKINNEECKPVKKNQIDFEEACTYIENFLRFPNLHYLAKTYVIGGFFSNNTINTIQKLATSIPAYKFYPCYRDTVSPIKDDVFLCMTNSSVECPCKPGCGDYSFLNNFLSRSTENFPYDMNGVSQELISDFLWNLSKDSSEKTEYINKIDVEKYSKSFYNKFKTSAPSDQNDLCFVMHKDTLDKLLKQDKDIIGFRYFLGYEERQDKKNMIRLIFIAVKKGGRNLILLHGKPAYIFEKDWPPDDCDIQK